MHNLIKGISIIATLVCLTGCTNIQFYEENDGDLKETGFLYYPPKPYLLIETKDGNAVTSIISLPDLSKPHRVKQTKGWGSSELGFEIENGMIKSFNSKTDSKGPETLTAISGLGTAQAALDTAKAAILTAELSAGTTTKMTDINSGSTVDIPINYNVKAFVEGADSLKQKVLPILSKEKSKLSYEIDLVNQSIAILQKNQTIDYQPLDPDALLNAVEEKRKLSKRQAEILKNVSATLDVYASNDAEDAGLILIAKSSNDELKSVIKSLLAFSLRSSSVNGLYEIQYLNGRLSLRKVVLE